jgi:signal transduction histidine kinase
MTIRLSTLGGLLAAVILLVTAGGIAATWRIADREFRDVLDDDLEQQAELLAELVLQDPARFDDSSFRDVLAATFEDDEEETVWVSVYELATGRVFSNLEHSLPLESADNESVSREFAGHAWHGVQEQVDGIVVQLLRRSDLFDEVRDEMLEQIVMPAVIGGLVTLLLLAVLIGLTLRPLSRLTREIETRGAESLDLLQTATAAREIRVVRDSINGLIASIDQLLRRERQFASDVAHELRTPLTTIKLELGGDDPDIHAVRSEVDRLARLVEQLLTLARLEQGQWRSRFESVALAELCAAVVDSLSPRLATAGIRLESHLDEAASTTGDATLLEILLRNLLQNIVEHCPAGTRASVGLDRADGKVRLRVADDGPGMPSVTRERIRAGFTRLDSRGEGLGVGLAICQRIVAAHGGAIRFDSVGADGTGLAVEVVLPA